MATVTQGSVAALRPCASRSAFLSGSLGKLNRTTLAIKPTTSSSTSFKIEAKKGEWLPGLASPGYLDGSLSGDNGFDPLGLAEDPESLKWFVQAELVNGRWAMLGVAGMLLPEVLTSAGLMNVPKWYDAGKSEYFASSSTLLVIEFILFHYVEIRRWQDIKNPGSVNQDPIFKSYSLPPNEVGYPGGIFNPLNFAPTAEAKDKEIANGQRTGSSLSTLGRGKTVYILTSPYTVNTVLRLITLGRRETSNVGVFGVHCSAQCDWKRTFR